jgi:uncharacterized protein
MGLRFIIFLAAIWIVLLIIRFYLGKASKKRHPKNSKNIESVRCKKCGLALPKKEAIQQGEHFFCSKEHLDD